MFEPTLLTPVIMLAVWIFLLTIINRIARFAAKWIDIKTFILRLRISLSFLLLGYFLADLISLSLPTIPQNLQDYISTIDARLVSIILAAFSVLWAVSELLNSLVFAHLGDKRIGRLVKASTYFIGISITVQTFLRSQWAYLVTDFDWRLLNTLIGVVAVYVVGTAIDVFTSKNIAPRVKDDKNAITAFRFIRRIFILSVWLLGFLTVLLINYPEFIGLAASSLIAAGFLSIVVGLAAQSTLSNLLSGLLIALTHPFRIGDAVVFKNEFCFVEDIKLFHTVLRTWDNRRLVIPNSLFQSEVIVNYSITDPTMLVPVFVDISYESDLDKAIKIMKELAEKHPLYLPAEGLPVVHVMELGESGIKLRLLARAKDQPTAFELAKQLLYQIKKEFEKQGIEIPYPRRYIIFKEKI